VFLEHADPFKIFHILVVCSRWRWIPRNKHDVLADADYGNATVLRDTASVYSRYPVEQPHCGGQVNHKVVRESDLSGAG